MSHSATNADQKIPTRPSLIMWVLLVVVAVGMGGAYLVFQASRDAKITGKARYAFHERNLKEARYWIARWLESAPKSAEAHYLMARVELAEGHDQATLNEMARAMELGYPADQLAPYRAVIQTKSEKYDEAEPILRKALADSDDPQPEIAEALARIYLNTFRLPQATGPLDRWMRDAPDDPKPYLWRNEVDSRRDADHSVLIQNYREALKRDPNLASARLGLADRLRQAHRLDEAAIEFETYLKMRPDDPEGLTGAGLVALKQGKTDDAVKHFEHVLKLNPHEPIALKELGVIDLKRNRHESARDRLREAIKFDPNDPDSHYNLARAYLLLGDPASAEIEDAATQKLRKEHSRMADLRASLVKRPKDLALRLEIAQWLLNHAHDDEGLNWAKQILHDHPGHEPTMRMLVDYYAIKKDPAKANYYRMLLRQADSSPKQGS